MITPIEAKISAFFATDRASNATPLTAPEYRPSPAEIVEVLMEHYKQPSEWIVNLILTSDFRGVNYD